jgi:hypothetical protein
MSNFAIIENDIVTNLIVADSLEYAQEHTGKSCIEYDPLDTVTGPNIGLSYIDGIFEQPVYAEES